MSKDVKIRWGWLKGMYIYTIVGAGGFGLGIIFLPEVIKSMFRWPVNEPVAFGVIGSAYVAFGLLSLLGLRSPLKFAPVLLLQLCYKSIWFIGVLLPLLISAHFSGLWHNACDYICILYHRRSDRHTFSLCFCEKIRSVDWNTMT